MSQHMRCSVSAISLAFALLALLGARPAQSDEQTAPAANRYFVSLAGIAVPSDRQTWSLAGSGGRVFSSHDGDRDVRIMANLQVADDGYTRTYGVTVEGQRTVWRGETYGFGGGVGLGWANFVDLGGGWDDHSGLVLAYAAPVLLRFGEEKQLELFLNVGAVAIFTHDVRGVGRVGVTYQIGRRRK